MIVPTTDPIVCEFCGIPIDGAEAGHWIALRPGRGPCTISYGNWAGEPVRYFHTGTLCDGRGPCYEQFVEALAKAGRRRRARLPKWALVRVVMAERTGWDLSRQQHGLEPIFFPGFGPATISIPSSNAAST